ncbi:MAG: M36 family metallopeptidase [Thermoanaerobaculia bacterium]
MRVPSPSSFGPFAFRKTLTLATTIAALALPAMPAAGRALDRPLPENYHARFDPEARAALAGESARAARTELSASERAAAADLAATTPALRISRDEFSLYPISMLSTQPGQMLSGAPSDRNTTADVAARDFLATHAALLGLTADDLSTFVVRYVTNPEGGATIVKFDQFVDGIQLFDSEFAVVMRKDLAISGVAGRAQNGIAASRSAVDGFRLGEADAIHLAIADLTGRDLAADAFAESADAKDGYRYFESAADLAVDRARAAGAPAADRFLSEATRVRPVLFPIAPGHLVASYYLELWVDGAPSGSGPVYSYVMSAEDGRVLFRNDLKQHDSYSYRTYAQNSGDFRPWDGPTGPIGTPHPTGAPGSNFQAPFITPAPLISIESLLGPTDPWLAPAATATTGNNTDAYLDLASPDGFSAGDVRGTGVAGSFDAQYDSTQNVNVAVNRQAAVIGMFYQVNWQHDYWYLRGFNELSGNAQVSNYGRGGAQGDDVRSEGQDFSGTDNANMTTPADGGRPKMQMFIFTAGGDLVPTRDGTFEMLIVGHEIMHYMSNRLVGNGSGLNNRQGGSMGEGWGDFNADLMTTEDTDNVVGTAYAIGGQTDRFACGSTWEENYYFSIRHYPYSSDLLKNPYTFKDIGPLKTTHPEASGNTSCYPNLISSPSEVHNAGEIWAEMLWEDFVALARRHGVATARSTITQYMIDGMKATTTSPTFTIARDGILMSANAVNAKDGLYLRSAFAKRGIGLAAIPPLANSTSHAGITEDFTIADPAAPLKLISYDDFETNDLSLWSSVVG